MEIGVLHGATSGYLSLFIGADSRLILIDPYQDFRVITDSISEFSGIDPGRILCIPEDSRLVYKMRGFYLDGFLPQVQIVHIDGEHSYDAVANDIHLSELYLMKGGLIVVDDIFNVASACCTHSLFDTIRQIPSLHIACIGFNKAFLCYSQDLAAYRNLFLELPKTFAQDHNIYIRACLNDWSNERGYISLHEISKGEPHYQAINMLFDDLDSLRGLQ